MSQSWDHCKTSVRRFGGKPEDYVDIHEWIDQYKGIVGDISHRQYLHNTMGPFLAQQVFGRTITNSDGKEVIVRDIVEIHIVEDLGWIPSPADWSAHLNSKVWMGGKRNKFLGREELLNASVPMANKSYKEALQHD